MVLKQIMRAGKVKAEGCIYNNMIQYLTYAEDLVITGKDQNSRTECHEGARKTRLIINKSKTGYVVSYRKGSLNGNLARRDCIFKSVQKFTY